MRVTYFAADLTDAATVRRVRILRRGGLDLKLVGFRRSASPVTEVEGVATVDLGQTFSGRLGHRFAQVLRQSWEGRNWKHLVYGSEALLARNLEMATIANATRRWAQASVPLVYECLDIHGAQLAHSLPSKLLRSCERHILRKSAALVVSSEAFVTNYFDHLGISLPPLILAENKRVSSDIAIGRPPCSRDHRQPSWRIGWFGLLRCTESFNILLGLAHRRRDVDITLRGRPVPEFQSLMDRYLPLPNMRFCGAYTEADLAAIYGRCDFTWAVEYAGQNAQNAKWAMGNRIYEGSYYNCPVMALSNTAMGTWLRRHKTGVVFNDPHAELERFIHRLTPVQYRDLRQTSADIPISDLAWTTQECRQFAYQVAMAGTPRAKWDFDPELKPI
jgi:succinoglycan biosynthesis protein ExoL